MQRLAYPACNLSRVADVTLAEWVEIKYKGKYAGEVFIEMTFYSAVSGIIGWLEYLAEMSCIRVRLRRQSNGKASPQSLVLAMADRVTSSHYQTLFLNHPTRPLVRLPHIYHLPLLSLCE